MLSLKKVKSGGGLAQLGEHLHGMQGVTSSSLVSSTIFIAMSLSCDCSAGVGASLFFCLAALSVCALDVLRGKNRCRKYLKLLDGVVLVAIKSVLMILLPYQSLPQFSHSSSPFV